MDYADAAERLFDRRRFRPDPGTETTAALLEYLDNPHTNYDCIQIAGSNGKGSTARFLASILEAAGYTVGLYTSPHLDTIRERIQVAGQPIRKHRIATYFDEVREYLRAADENGTGPTFFETVTGLALWQFEQKAVDYAVLEVGMGGRYDATSVVDPIASAVTSVTLEHTDVLGDSIDAIAADKATVAAEDTPLVTATSGAAFDTIDSTVEATHRVGTDPDADTTVTYHGHDDRSARIEIRNPAWSVDTQTTAIGAFQARNAGVAAVLATQLIDISPTTLESGLRTTTIPGRMEIMATAPLTIIDGAHNPGACAALTDAITGFDYDALHLVFGAMQDKDHAGMIDALPTPATVHTTAAPVDRAADPADLAAPFTAHGTDTTVNPSVEDALTTALDVANSPDLVLVCGSLAVVAAGRRHWTRTPIPRHVIDHDDVTTTLETLDCTPATGTVETAAFQHTVITMTVPTPHATQLIECATDSDLAIHSSPLTDIDHELVPLALAGSTAAFTDFIVALQHADDAVTHYARSLETTLATDSDTVSPWGDRTAVMGILNVTPDSFHDGGRHTSVDAARDHAASLIDAGADIIDIGGESTRPGADPVSIDTERDRVLPVVDAITEMDATVSVDTRRSAVARPALEAGADIINDVSGGTDPELLFAVADHDARVVLMHSTDTPVDPGRTPDYDDVVTDVITELVDPVHRASRLGLDHDQIIVDPGLGFGKSPADSFTLLNRLDELHALACPVMVGHSYKSMFDTAGFPEDERSIPTVAATALAADRGADIVRVHDVAPNYDTITTQASVIGDHK